MLIFDRTQADVDNQTPKGYYTAEDLNRVGAKINQLSTEILELLYLHTPTNAKENWTMASIPHIADIYSMLSKLYTVVNAFFPGAITVSLPGHIKDYQQANDVEKALYDVEETIANIKASYAVCGVAECGVR